MQLPLSTSRFQGEINSRNQFPRIGAWMHERTESNENINEYSNNYFDNLSRGKTHKTIQFSSRHPKTFHSSPLGGRKCLYWNWIILLKISEDSLLSCIYISGYRSINKFSPCFYSEQFYVDRKYFISKVFNQKLNYLSGKQIFSFDFSGLSAEADIFKYLWRRRARKRMRSGSHDELDNIRATIE